MDAYKEEFIQYLLDTGALKIGQMGKHFTLKSKRLSPWLVNVGDLNDGVTSRRLGEFYAKIILQWEKHLKESPDSPVPLTQPESSGVQPSSNAFDLLYGIPEKGNALAVVTAIALAESGRNVPWFFTRKVPKDYGEASGLTAEERLKKWVVGRVPKDGQAIVQLDDVFTAGDAKYQARDTLLSMGKFALPLLAIAVDRQEVGIDGKSAISEYEKRTGTKVESIVKAIDIYNYIRQRLPLMTPNDKITKEQLDRMANYLRVYGTKEARTSFAVLEQRIISRDRSVIPACDMQSLEEFESLVKATADIDGIGGYKIGLELGLGFGLNAVVRAARKHTDKPIIYDHQKACTDIPETGKKFAEVCRKAGVDTVILFPQSGPEAERAWIYHALDNRLNVIVGGRMTHPAYCVSEGGFITDEGALEMYRIAAQAGVSNFVVPGNKPEAISQIRALVESEGVSASFYAPGFIAQGGSISDAAKAAGDRFHGIVGRAIYEAQDKRKAAIEHCSKL